jgi:hypothetical protein
MHLYTSINHLARVRRKVVVDVLESPKKFNSLEAQRPPNNSVPAKYGNEKSNRLPSDNDNLSRSAANAGK